MGSLLEDLGRALPRLRATDDAADRVAYARDLWPRHHLAVRAGNVAEHRPSAIVWPSSTEEVASVVTWAKATGTPIVPFGAGSGVCAGILPDARTVVIDLKRLARVRSLDPAARTVEVEAGQMGLPFEEELERRGLTLGHFPSSILCSTVGGWVAARSAGQCSGKYGKIEDMVLALECVTGEGEIVTLRHRTSGPSLVPLVVGSEGTLGIVTSATLRLHAQPTSRAFAAFTFPTTVHGWEGMRELFQRGFRPAVARLYDPFDAMLARRGAVKKGGADGGGSPGLGAAALRSVLRSPGALNELLDGSFGSKMLGGALLVLIFEGEGDGPERDGEAARAVLERMRGTYEGEGPARKWLLHRYAVSYRQAPVFAAGLFSDTMEVAAPWSKLESLYDEVRRALGEHVFVMAHLSHAYPDGCCIYFSFAGTAAAGNEDGWDGRSEVTYDRAWRTALDAVVRAGGTIAHHHGVGRSKAPRLRVELGSAGIGAVQALMRAFDPAGILNPGNLVARDETFPSDDRSDATVREAAPNVDATSLLVDAPGSARLEDLETTLAAAGLGLGLGDGRALAHATVAEWLARGAPGARSSMLDPADHLVAGLVTELPNGHELRIHPSPRRSTGPDLSALYLGAHGRFGPILRATLRVHRRGVPRVSAVLPAFDADAAVSNSETSLLDAIGRELRA